ncbi:MAG: ABC-type lipoprotein release transport system permease subunit [Rhodoferax sp.]
MLEQCEKSVCQHFIETISDKDMLKRQAVVIGNGLAQSYGLKVGVKFQPLLRCRLDRRNDTDEGG